jgi:AcrR family transcriptional regulator
MGHEVYAKLGGIEVKTPPRERILTAAGELFERYGIRGVGVEAIAEAADTNKMTLYRHFSSKDDLVAAWLNMVVKSWAAQWEALERIPDTISAHTKIDLFLEEYGSAFEHCAVRGCPLMNSLAELPEKDHPARRVLEEYKAEERKRMIKFLRKVGVTGPAQAADEIQLLLDGAKAGVQDWGAARSRARFIQMAKTLLEARLARAH